uniref:Ycf49-like protein n=1 Tax=Chromera velia CCMP2878 TaxID=1169474 RepID=A0A0G4H1D7_9ALVE|eukprot:Cvel_799.t1-p1 / transcript=Cvel_799.t1 / gene=Cvel_799 / organism=Chromera_velia_CCMP2878 / gene_product=Ycf49-like protein, putative / transcript_product=Ycf49-like protein, putative / location=Cvel_scaffold25:26444-30456(+) / protein_length=552 / sequence_SO=supercontig / SO=protein_coding / is_pseudo=false
MKTLMHSRLLQATAVACFLGVAAGVSPAFVPPRSAGSTPVRSGKTCQTPVSDCRLPRLVPQKQDQPSSSLRAFIDPWSVNSETLATQLFAASLPPYLAFLYFLGREETKTPKLPLFGFWFLLVFVFATIPAGIYAKVAYGEKLANVDWLHGSSESLLTITNLLIVVGFRRALASAGGGGGGLWGDGGETGTSLSGDLQREGKGSAESPRGTVARFTKLSAIRLNGGGETAMSGGRQGERGLKTTDSWGRWLSSLGLWAPLGLAAGSALAASGVGLTGQPPAEFSGESRGVSSLLLSLRSAGFPLFLRQEPLNALSLPTWTIHVSSVVEWLVAMGLVWQWGERRDREGRILNPRWKGLTWGMLPLHTSGLIACTYHIYYNAPTLDVLVAMQAALTVVGDILCALAAFRIFCFEKERGEVQQQEEARKFGGGVLSEGKRVQGSGSEGSGKKESDEGSLMGWEDLGEALRGDSDVAFVGKLAAVSLGIAAAVKYGELGLEFPFEADLGTAVAVFGIPSALNIAKWSRRSRESDRGGGGGSGPAGGRGETLSEALF